MKAKEQKERKPGAAVPARFDFLFIEEWLLNTLAMTFPASDSVCSFHPSISFMPFDFKESRKSFLECMGRWGLKSKEGRKCQDSVGTPWSSTCPEAVQLKGSSRIFQPPGKLLTDVYLLSYAQEADHVSQRLEGQQGHLLIPL